MLVLSFATGLIAQTDEQRAAQEKARLDQLGAATKDADAEGWTHRGAFGLDLGQLLNINPYPGSGNSRLGLGGAIQYKAHYRRQALQWKNEVLFNFSAERTGTGTVSAGSDEKNPFRKALDLLQFTSNVAYRIRENSPWFFAFDAGLRTQLLNSYVDSASQVIYLRQLRLKPYNTSLVSKFFSPALINIAPGIQYSKTKDLQIFLSPLAGQIIVIGDEAIANLGVHGTALKEGSTTDYERSKFALGAYLKTSYSHTFFQRLNVSSELGLFSDYLDQPQNIDVAWVNQIGIELFKGLQLGLAINLFYDDDKVNNITDFNSPGGISGQGRRVNLIEQLLLNYTRSF